MEVSTLIDSLKAKNYAIFENDTKDFNINIVGVRSDIKKANKFDDKLYVFWKFNGTWNLKEYTITTDPGNKSLKEFENPKGCAILVPNQYRGTWQIGLHHGEYEALCQMKPVKVYRDSNKDDILDFDPKTITEGIYGINIHRSNPTTESENVENWSAGCQVFKRVKDFKEFMDICRKARDIYGNSFTYTLLLSSDIKQIA